MTKWFSTRVEENEDSMFSLKEMEAAVKQALRREVKENTCQDDEPKEPMISIRELKIAIEDSIEEISIMTDCYIEGMSKPPCVVAKRAPLEYINPEALLNELDRICWWNKL